MDMLLDYLDYIFARSEDPGKIPARILIDDDEGYPKNITREQFLNDYLSDLPRVLLTDWVSSHNRAVPKEVEKLGDANLFQLWQDNVAPFYALHGIDTPHSLTKFQYPPLIGWDWNKFDGSAEEIRQILQDDPEYAGFFRRSILWVIRVASQNGIMLSEKRKKYLRAAIALAA